MPRRSQLLVALCLSAVAVALYWPTLDHGFVFDDLWNIQQNEALRLEALELESLARASRGAPGMGNRPVSNLSFALNFFTARPDPGPRAYRWTNLLIHAGSSALVYGIFLLTLSVVAAGRSSPTEAVAGPDRPVPISVAVAALASLLWLAHPIQTQSVTYLHQRMTSLAAFFLLGSLFAYIVGRRAAASRIRWTAFVTAAVCAALALGSKEIAVVLPIVLVLYEWTFLQGLKRSWLRRRRKQLVLALLLLVVIAWLYLGPAWSWLEWIYSQVPYSPGQRLLTQSRVVVFGLSLLLLPHPSRLNVDHDVLLSTSLFDPPATLFSLGLLAVLVWLIVYCARRRLRFAFFGLLWIFVTQVIESSVIPVEMMAEHRLYLPSVGLLFVLLEITSIRRQAVLKWACVVAAGAVPLFCLWTLERNQVWRDSASLWTDSAGKSPGKLRPLNNLGLSLARRGETARAIAQFRQVVILDPKHAQARFNLGNALLDKGVTQEAIHHLSLATEGRADLFVAQYTLGLALLRAGDHGAAEERLILALRLRPQSPEAHYEMGNALRLQGKAAAAERHYFYALGKSPELVRRHYELAGHLFDGGQAAQAIELCETILQVQPDNAVVHSRLAVALAELGRFDEAQRHCEQALALDPQLMSAQRLLEALAQVLEQEEEVAGPAAVSR